RLVPAEEVRSRPRPKRRQLQDCVGRRLSARWKSAGTSGCPKSGQDPNECVKWKPRAAALSFPLFRPSRAGTSRGRRSPHAEGGAPSAHRQEVNTVEFEPCPGDVAQLGEHLPCTQGV